MAKWLESGRRRDCCYVLAREGAVTGQELKTALEAHYDQHLEPSSFYATLDRLETTGHVTATTEGVHDSYELTDGGRRRLEAHHAWTSACLEE